MNNTVKFGSAIALSTALAGNPALAETTKYTNEQIQAELQHAPAIVKCENGEPGIMVAEMDADMNDYYVCVPTRDWAIKRLADIDADFQQ